MLASNARPQIERILDPLGQRLARSGLSPNVVTVVGTVGVTAAALIAFPGGHFFWGTVVITLFVFSDMLDGLIARATGRSSTFGAFLDSTSDRIGDSAIFGAIAMWFAGRGHYLPLAAAAIYCLAAGSLISYIKARAESVGFTCNVGIAERGERLLIVLVAAGLYGLGIPYLLPAALWILCGLTTITIGQRLVHVYRQAKPAEGGTDTGARRPGRQSARRRTAAGVG